MIDQARSALSPNATASLAQRPDLMGTIGQVAEAVASWPGVIAATHWSVDYSEIEGVDFFLGNKKLGQIYVDGSIRLATEPAFRPTIVAERLARSFSWARGRALPNVKTLGIDGATDLFRRNYDRLATPAS